MSNLVSKDLLGLKSQAAQTRKKKKKSKLKLQSKKNMEAREIMPSS